MVIPELDREPSSRETEVLQLVAEGKANKEIAAELNVGTKTVETHRQRLMNRLNIHDVAGLRAMRSQRGLSRAALGRPRR